MAVDGCGPDRPSPAGGRRQWGGERGRLGPKDCIPYHTAHRPPVCNQRLPEILDGQHPPGGSTSARRVAARHRAHSPDRHGRGLGLGPRREGALYLGRVRLRSSWLPELLGPGNAQNAGAAKSGLLWNTGGLEPRAAQSMLHIEQLGA